MAQTATGRREQLLEAAREEFARRGYHGTTVRDICNRCGVAAGTFYLYFATKEGCFLGLIDDLYGEVLAAVVQARSGLEAPLDKLEASLVAVLRTFAEHAALARIVLVHAPGTHPEFDARLRELHVEFARLVGQELDEAAASGAIPAQDTATAALVIIGAVYEVTIAHLEGRTAGSLDQVADSLARLLRRAVGAKG